MLLPVVIVAVTVAALCTAAWVIQFIPEKRRRGRAAATLLLTSFGLWGLVAVNGLVFGLTEIAIGGSATSGKEENGQYYVHVHTRYTPVSRAAYERICCGTNRSHEI